MRKMVTIMTPDNPEPREFHLEDTKAHKFVAVIADGGTAVIGPFKPDMQLRATLVEAGINPWSVR
jgi:hypothetical protein